MPRTCNSIWICALIAAGSVQASEHRGVVKSNGLPVPGVTITATKGDKKAVTTTDANGNYAFADLEDGVWNFQLSMIGFAKTAKEVGVTPGGLAAQWELKLMTLAEIKAASAPPPAATPKPAPASVPSSTPAPAQERRSRPSIAAATQAAAQGGRGGRGTAAGPGFQRAAVNQSEEAPSIAEPNLSNEMVSDLSQSANDSFLVNGSVSRGLGMPEQPDWGFPGGRGGFDGLMGFGPGMGPGMGPGGFGDGSGPNMGTDGAGGQDGAGGGRGGRGGPGGPGGPGGRGGPMMAGGRGGPGGGPGGFGGPGGRGGGPGGGFGGQGGGRGGRGAGGARGGRGGPAGVAAFGNARRNPRMRYNGNLGFTLDNSVWDAQTFSVSGNQVQRPAYANGRGSAMIGGPLKIPHLISGTRSMFTLNYQISRNRTGATQTQTMPTALERMGDFSQSVQRGPVTIYDPLTGLPFPGNVIPQNRISPIATGLLQFYPLPNFNTTARNYSAPIVRSNNSHNINARLNQTLSRTDRLNGGIGFQSGSSVSPNLFDFIDNGSTRGMNINVSYSKTIRPRLISNLSYTFSRNRNLNSPFFSLNRNIEAELGITGASTNPINWGPPSLNFTNFGGLSDGQASLSRNQTSAVNEGIIWIHKLHNVQLGVSYRRQQINLLSDSNARGTFTFTGSATSQYLDGVAAQNTGFDFADFLLGRPNASSINYGNADKYFRTAGYSAYINDDWRISTKFTLNGGLRWDYQTPVRELFNRLVNLDIAPGFGAIAPVVAGGVGPLTGIHYPDSLIRPDRNNFSPRLGFAWRPFPKHSTRVNGGYGLYFNTGAYQQMASSLAAQPPFAQNYSLASTLANPLSISTFQLGTNLLTNTRAIDPFYTLGYAQIWQLSLQNDLGRALVGTISFNHTKGTHLDQQFLPNSLPPGSKAISIGPAGYIYQQTGGNSTFNSVQFNLNRRFRSGISANLSYMWSKALDNGGIGTLIAQDWRNLSLERGLSSFDARHTVNATWQYSSGTGRRGGALMRGWKGLTLKDWTFSNRISLRTGSPLTATAGGNRSVVSGTGVTGPVRANATGISLDPATPGYGFNLLAFEAPAAGEWGTAGRNVIPGPMIFSLDGSLRRAFRLSERKNLDFAADITNALNRVTITNWGTTLNSSTFGLPTSAAGMRRMNLSLRLRF